MLKNFLIITLLSLSIIEVQGQFVINENFKSKKTTDEIVLGGEASLTAGVIDPDGDGWLRITPALSSRKGYAFINKSFSSGLGIIAEFEFKAWRPELGDAYTGGDGFSVFLFDGSVTKENFMLGGFGSSLGYTRNSDTNPKVENGLNGGFIGIGFDSYGAFGNTLEGKSGMIGTGTQIPKDPDVGNSYEIPNTIVLRGATIKNDNSNSNRILAYAKLGDRSGTVKAMRLRSELDYDVKSITRPTDAQFYRKVKIIIKPVLDKDSKPISYIIQVYMVKSINATYDATPLINYTTTQNMPETLKIGFAASTGGAMNNHELRNLQITTTGNLGVFNSVDVPLSCSELQSQKVTFRIDVNNSNSVEMSKIDLESKFLNKVGGRVLNENEFKISTINHSSHITKSTIKNESNTLKGEITLPANTTGSIFVNGTIIKPNTQVVNTVNVSSSELIDQDLSNNTSTEISKRYQCKVTTNPMIYIKSK